MNSKIIKIDSLFSERKQILTKKMKTVLLKSASAISLVKCIYWFISPKKKPGI